MTRTLRARHVCGISLLVKSDPIYSPVLPPFTPDLNERQNMQPIRSQTTPNAILNQAHEILYNLLLSPRISH
jgi:hypothetical protein